MHIHYYVGISIEVFRSCAQATLRTLAHTHNEPQLDKMIIQKSANICTKFKPPFGIFKAFSKRGILKRRVQDTEIQIKLARYLSSTVYCDEI